MPNPDRPRDLPLATKQLNDMASSAVEGWKDPSVSKAMAKNRNHSFDVAIDAFDTATAQQRARAKAKFKQWQNE